MSYPIVTEHVRVVELIISRLYEMKRIRKIWITNIESKRLGIELSLLFRDPRVNIFEHGYHLFQEIVVQELKQLSARGKNPRHVGNPVFKLKNNLN